MANNLTPAQERARAWLPPDGSWKSDAGYLSMALSSLSRAWPKCLQREWGPFGANGGQRHRWRLTEKGIEDNAAVIATEPVMTTRLHSALAGITAARTALRDPLPDADAAIVGPHLAGLGTILAAVRARLEKAIEAVERVP